MTDQNVDKAARSAHPADPKAMRIAFFSFNDENALAVLRMLGPARAAGLEIIHGVTTAGVDPGAARLGDLVVIQREYGYDYNAYEQVVKIARELGKPIVLDLDDLLIALPEDHPDRLAGNFAPSLLPLMQSIIEADLVTVPTVPLRENLLAYNPNIAVLPNYLDDALWQLKPSALKEASDEPVVIGYMGGHSHTPDLRMVQPALLQLVDKYGAERVRFQFWGIEPPPELAPYSKVDWLPPLSPRYVDFVQFFQQQAVDIAIAPLCDTLFNACKSGIKFIDYSAIAAAGVYSQVAPYVEIVEHGEDGFLAGTTGEWVAALSQLVESPALRKSFVEHAQAKVRRSWLLSQHAAERKQVYARLIENYQPGQKTYPPFFDLMKDITRQLYEDFVRGYNNLQALKSKIKEKDWQIETVSQQLSDRDQTIEAKEMLIAEKESRIQSLEDEVVAYASSQSWRLTRPLRKLSRKW